MESKKIPSGCKGLTVTINRELAYHLHKTWMIGISVGQSGVQKICSLLSAAVMQSKSIVKRSFLSSL